VTGRIMIPTLTFIYQNVHLSISAFYGSTSPLYHLTQSLPILLFPLWYWWGQGFASCLLPFRFLPARLTTLDRPEGLRIVARGLTFTIAIVSLSPHSEWRFLHPLLPPLLLFALPPIFQTYTASMLGCGRFTYTVRQYVRFPKLPFYLCLYAPILPVLYLGIFHGYAQVEVMDVLRRGSVGEVKGLIALMPCHSTPWMSHLHQDVDAWFLTCEPPIE
jgi:phosphatidylinositol glycan class B